MTAHSIIKKSHLEGATRLDAEYYQPEYFIDFKKGKWIPINDVLELCQYGISQAMNTERRGYPIFKMDNIDYAMLFDDEVKCVDISDSIHDDFVLQKDDVFFNRVNSEEFVGRTGIFKLDLDSVFASYLIRLRVKSDADILPDYLNIFLNSKYGLKQIRKYARRAVNQVNVNAEELKQMKIAVLPLKFQQTIKQIVNESWDNFMLSKTLYTQAENLLLEKSGLKDFEVEDDLGCVVNLSDVQEAKRMDAEYFQPKYAKLISKLVEKKSFAEIIEAVPAKFDPSTKPEKPFQYVELSNISQSIGVIDGYSEVLGKDAPSRAKRILQANDVIVSSVEGSLGKVALASKEQEGYLASTGFFQLRSKEILPEVLLVLAKSFVLQMQLQKQTAGTILTAVPKEAVNNLQIPSLPKSTQQKIADLVRRSHEARKKAKELLEEAKRRVEEMIEEAA